MTHDNHSQLVGEVLYDGCGECTQRASWGIDGFSSIDDHNLAKLGALALLGYTESTSNLDRKMVELLKVMARIVFRSQIKEEGLYV